MKFIGVNSVYRIANGGITLHPFDRGGIELSLMGYVIADRFLWASDYSQTVREASAYATDVWHAAQRDELHPEHTAAEHLPLTPWTTIKGLQK